MAQTVRVSILGEAVELPVPPAPLPFNAPLSDAAIRDYVEGMDSVVLQPYLTALLHYRQRHHPDDWLYYQAVRSVAQRLSPKTDNYYRYTFYKWWLLVHSGYDALLTHSGTHLLLYVHSDEAVYNIPYRTKEGKQYVCLNYHDYREIDFEEHFFTEAPLAVLSGAQPFSYRIANLPDFEASAYTEKEVRFSNGARQYSFRIKLNTQLKTLFTNYPAMDYGFHFNTPLSTATYESLIPSLKKETASMKQKEGVEFLMRFTRYAFLFKPDAEVFGGEKRMSPEQTLLYEYSDCEDRAALFFCLVKEVYNLPMLVLTYPDHVTVAVKFEKGYGETITYNGLAYSVCEPSPQRYDLQIGELLPELKRQQFEIVYIYHPN